MSFLTRICLPPTDKERHREYESKFAEFDEEHLRRAALGVAVKRRMLLDMRNREIQKRMRVDGVEVIVRRPKLSRVR
jgi:hypothetical protein